ncbi:MBL fold metallo-hydrolase [Paenibacillus gorillae]|uniref:MBL fold metallo-hydrolase n=1 Tax=Paenibacillus gorillae TaxID=1243662 RepID=UPI0004B924AD|nr:MBL fold metallo-hydrolase [Paenibacillus gorillae]
MKLQLIRNATLRLQYAGVELLIDPMLSEAGSSPPIINTANDRRNPLVPLPAAYETDVLPDAVFVTHLHNDHWDEAARKAIPHTTPILCQPGDEGAIAESGFGNVTPIVDTASFQGIAIRRFGGQHGTGDIGKMLGPVSGFLLQAEGEPSIYIAGDTIWCSEVEDALDGYHPDITVVNAGGARFVEGDPIIMDAADVASVCRHAPYTKVVAAHMDAINHCYTTRAGLRKELESEGLLNQVLIPEDGEWLELSAE